MCPGTVFHGCPVSMAAYSPIHECWQESQKTPPDRQTFEFRQYPCRCVTTWPPGIQAPPRPALHAFPKHRYPEYRLTIAGVECLPRDSRIVLVAALGNDQNYD